MHGLAVYVKGGLPFAQNCSLEKSVDSYVFMKMFSTVFTSLSILLLFLLSITFFVLGTVFYVISSNIDQVLLFNPSANVFVTFITFIIRTVELVELIEIMNSVILSQMTLLRWLIFLLALWLSQSCPFGYISFF